MEMLELLFKTEAATLYQALEKGILIHELKHLNNKKFIGRTKLPTQSNNFEMSKQLGFVFNQISYASKQLVTFQYTCTRGVLKVR